MFIANENIPRSVQETYGIKIDIDIYESLNSIEKSYYTEIENTETIEFNGCRC